MFTPFTPPPAVKQEPVSPKQVAVKLEPMGPPDTPWAMQAVTIPARPTQPEVVVRVEPVRPPKQEKPWEAPRPPVPKPRRIPAVHPGPSHRAPHAPPEWRERPQQEETPPTKAPSSAPTDGSRLICAKNYAAVEAGLERFGLIDMGARSSSRSLVIHARKRCRPAFALLNEIRPGTLLHVRRKGGKAHSLRVRFTTPARYYSPGALVTTLAVGVDEADWQSLMADTPRI